MTNKVVELLNTALKEDPKAIESLFSYRVKCNESLGNNEYIVVTQDLTVSPIGIINGILNLMGENKVSYILDDETKELVGFTNYGE